MPIKYVYIFDFIIFLTWIYSIVKNDKNYNVILSSAIGFIGISLGHIMYRALLNIHNEILVIAFLTVVEFIEIILSIKVMKVKSIIMSVVTSVSIAFLVLCGIQIETQSLYKYDIDKDNKGISIIGFSDKYKEDDYVEIPKFIIKDFKIYKVTEIGEKAFYECNYIHEVELPDSIKKIGNYAFAECTRLELINIPNDLEKIGARAFYETNISDDIELDDNIKIYDYFDNYIRHVNTHDYYDSRDIRMKDGVHPYKNKLCLTDLGYLNENGEISIYCEAIGDFSEGLARVKKNGKYGYIDINRKCCNRLCI